MLISQSPCKWRGSCKAGPNPELELAIINYFGRFVTTFQLYVYDYDSQELISIAVTSYNWLCKGHGDCLLPTKVLTKLSVIHTCKSSTSHSIQRREFRNALDNSVSVASGAFCAFLVSQFCNATSALSRESVTSLRVMKKKQFYRFFN